MSVHNGQGEDSQRKGSMVIPVGKEPRRVTESRGLDQQPVVSSEATYRKKPLASPRKRKGPYPVRQSLRERASKLRDFTVETMGGLRKSELQVWLAIFNCDFEVATIGYSRLMEVTKLSRRHVGIAVKSLEEKGLLRVLPGGNLNRIVPRARVTPVPTKLTREFLIHPHH